jgi:CRP-like cAMP-binding protein
MNTTQVQTVEELQEKLRAISKLQHFKLDPSFLEKCSANFELTIYSQNDIIVTEGNHESKIYWILSGTCKCTKKLSFLEKQTPNGIDIKPLTKGMKVDSNEKILTYDFDLIELEATDHFPGIHPESVDLKRMVTSDQDNYNSLMRGFLGDAELDSSIIEYSVVATSTTEIAMIQKSDYLNFASEKMIEETSLQKNMFNITTEQLQKDFLEQVEWSKFKTGTMKTLTAKNKTTRKTFS